MIAELRRGHRSSVEISGTRAPPRRESAARKTPQRSHSCFKGRPSTVLIPTVSTQRESAWAEPAMAEGESRRDHVRDKVMGIEGKWVFGRVMPRDLLEGVSRCLKRAAPEREKELVDQIRSRAEELSDAEDDAPTT